MLNHITFPNGHQIFLPLHLLYLNSQYILVSQQYTGKTRHSDTYKQISTMLNILLLSKRVPVISFPLLIIIVFSVYTCLLSLSPHGYQNISSPSLNIVYFSVYTCLPITSLYLSLQWVPKKILLPLHLL